MEFLEALEKLIEEKVPWAAVHYYPYYDGESRPNLFVHYHGDVYQIWDDCITTWCKDHNIDYFDIADPSFDPQMIITIIMNGGYK